MSKKSKKDQAYFMVYVDREMKTVHIDDERYQACFPHEDVWNEIADEWRGFKNDKEYQEFYEPLFMLLKSQKNW